ncbi:FAD/NAD(P)-binding domain-containing protein [Xylariaceae sp. FL0255]|nr:FAD/NAD(P)-binding domain-containing protein [Xylariaceae sp. FL0255]
MRILIAIAILASLASANTGNSSAFDAAYEELSTVIERDVCIIGGGSSGMHAAVSLHDLKKSVVVVERNNYLGGHAHTYVDPETYRTVELGVIIWLPLPEVIEFFTKFKEPLINISFTTGGNVPGQPANLSLPAVLYRFIPEYFDFRDDYTYLLTGDELPSPVPADLYLPFGEFLNKHSIQPVIPELYQAEQGLGSLLDVLTIYVAKYFNLYDIRILEGASSYLTAGNGNLSQLFSRAGDYIGSSNILLQSSVIATKRENTRSGRPEVLVSTEGSGLKTLVCKQILSTIPPTLDNLKGWDLSDAERKVFSQFTRSSGYWTGLVTNVGLNQSIGCTNAAVNTSFNIPVLPGLYDLNPVGVLNDVWSAFFGSDDPTMTDDQVKVYAVQQIQELQKATKVPVTEPKWLIFESLSPYQLQVSPEAVEAGFFTNLDNLQGGFHNTMFYTGAAFHTHYSSLLWRFNKNVIIPRMLNSHRTG